MAIKDQCTQCYHHRNDICDIRQSLPVFDQTSCVDYKKVRIDLTKHNDNMHNENSTIIGGSIPPPPPLPNNGQPYTQQIDEPTRLFAHPFSFHGRIRRMEYGLSILIFIVIFIALFAALESYSNAGVKAITICLFIPTYWFCLAQECKRFHDRDKSGWHILTYFIPLYRYYVIFMQFFGDGDEYENDYGPDPKGRNILS